MNLVEYVRKNLTEFVGIPSTPDVDIRAILRAATLDDGRRDDDARGGEARTVRSREACRGRRRRRTHSVARGREREGSALVSRVDVRQERPREPTASRRQRRVSDDAIPRSDRTVRSSAGRAP